ncbi:hypothetical protein NEISICOT_03264 [Neisseria sicca ATCC 29256]|uniref:Uncharacterized protein n=1 Tax=Neisseria sicca ATCC 29256 TaxID=547045 RepID=C6M9N6_NEISI|nr:hypothetical protein NEISICOT_03264 [Neisseria sicca ATCC 29256]
MLHHVFIVVGLTKFRAVQRHDRLRSFSIKANCSMAVCDARSSEKHLSIFHFIKVALSDDL